MNSLEKMMSLLDVFTPATPIWSTDDLIQYTGTSPSTCYRYIKILHQAGLLARVSGASYILGPRIMELDRTIRLCDPVYVAGAPAARALTDRTGLSALLCILYSDSIMCVHRTLSPDAPPQLFNRGQKRPLLAGASAKAILAYLPMHQLRSIYAKNREGIESVNLGSTWDLFKKALKRIRADGYATTTSEYNAGVVSIAAPLFNAEGDVLGSLAVVTKADTEKGARILEHVPDLLQASEEISARIATLDMTALPARAVG